MTLLLLLLISTFSAVHASELLVADLKGSGQSISEIPCWNDDGTFNEEICERSETSCELSGKSSSFNQTLINLNLPKPINSYGPGMKIEGQVTAFISGLQGEVDYSNSYNSNEIKFRHKYPVGSNITIYALKRSLETPEITILKNAVIPQSGFLGDVEDNKAIHTVRINLPKKENNYSRYMAEIFNFRHSISKDFLELKLSIGVYPITIWHNFGSTSPSKFKFILKVKPSPAGPAVSTNKVLTLDSKKFVASPASSRKSLTTIHWYQDYSTKELKPQLGLRYEKEGSEQIFVNTIKSFTLNNDKSLDLAPYLEVKKGEVKVPESKQEEFFQKINQFPVYSMTLSGTCYHTKKKALQNKIAVFAGPGSESKLLGNIIVVVGPSPYEIATSFETPEKKISEFHVNLMAGSCRGESTPDLLHVVRERKGEWVNLGKGPWGNAGWSQVGYKSIESMGDYFEFSNLSWAQIKQLENGLVLIKGQDFSRSENEIQEPGDESPEVNVEFRIEADKLWDKNGNFMARPDCSYGC